MRSNLGAEDIKRYWRFYLLVSLLGILAVVLAATITTTWLAILVGYLIVELAMAVFHFKVVEELVEHRDGWRVSAYKALDEIRGVTNE